MAKKQEIVVSDKARLMDVRWINTPFAFAKLGKRTTLLQMQVLLKVSELLQDYIKDFFATGRNLSKEDPLNLFSEEISKDIPTLRIPYSDFCVEVNNRANLYSAIDEMFAIRIKAPIIKDGMYKMEWIPIFKKIVTDIAKPTSIDTDTIYREGYAEFVINDEAAAYAFNMNLGYVNHPTGLAANSSQRYAPMLYFHIKHKLRRGKTNAVIDFSELRDAMGMDAVKDEKEAIKASDFNTKYPKFSEFRKCVLDPAVEEINRMASLNLLDITVTYSLNYVNGVERGNPDSITFNVALSPLGIYHKNPKEAMKHIQITDAAPEPTRKRGRPRKVKTVAIQPGEDLFAQETPQAPEGEEQWKTLLQTYTGPLSEQLKAATYKGFLLGAFCIDIENYLDADKLIAGIRGDAQLQSLLNKLIPGEYPTKLKVGYKK